VAQPRDGDGVARVAAQPGAGHGRSGLNGLLMLP